MRRRRGRRRRVRLVPAAADAPRRRTPPMRPALIPAPSSAAGSRRTRSACAPRGSRSPRPATPLAGEAWWRSPPTPSTAARSVSPPASTRPPRPSTMMDLRCPPCSPRRARGRGVRRSRARRSRRGRRRGAYPRRRRPWRRARPSRNPRGLGRERGGRGDLPGPTRQSSERPPPRQVVHQHDAVQVGVKRGPQVLPLVVPAHVPHLHEVRSRRVGAPRRSHLVERHHRHLRLASHRPLLIANGGGTGAARSAVRAVGADEVDPGGLTGARVADDGDADLPDPLRRGRRPEHRKLATTRRRFQTCLASRTGQGACYPSADCC